MGGGTMGGRGRFWRGGPAFGAAPLGILAQKPLPNAPVGGGGLGEMFFVPVCPYRRLTDCGLGDWCLMIWGSGRPLWGSRTIQKGRGLSPPPF
jgi:hypothetical protein